MKCPVCKQEYADHIEYEDCYNSHFEEEDQYITYHRYDLKRIRKEEYFEGYRQALYDFAVWQDGRQMVGCGTYTYQQALERKRKELFGDKDEI